MEYLTRAQVVEVLRIERPTGNTTHWERGSMDEWNTIAIQFALAFHPKDRAGVEAFVAECAK